MMSMDEYIEGAVGAQPGDTGVNMQPKRVKRGEKGQKQTILATWQHQDGHCASAKQLKW